MLEILLNEVIQLTKSQIKKSIFFAGFIVANNILLLSRMSILYQRPKIKENYVDKV